ncbi:hypothetical protein PIB30_092094, partial [Stylosanthes scabra]|nr:hypothetical protein [Stylosanthes scabra]
CDEKADSYLAIVKRQRYHFEDETFVHPLHSIWFDLNCLYELPVESLLACQCQGPLEKKEPILRNLVHLENQSRHGDTTLFSPKAYKTTWYSLIVSQG